MIFPCTFWEIWSFIFRLKNKIILLEKRNIIFADNTKKINFFLEKPSLLTICRKNNITMYLFKEDHVSFSIQRITVFISEKEIPSFLVITERSSSRTLAENIIFPCIFLIKMIFNKLQSKTIFSGKKKSFLVTKNFIFQCVFFLKTIFSEHLKIEDMAFRAVLVHLIC